MVNSFFESDPEISLGFKHLGLSVSLTAKIEARDWLMIPTPGEESTERLCRICSAAVPVAAEKLAGLVLEAHAKFQESLNLADIAGFRAYGQSKKPNV